MHSNLLLAGIIDWLGGALGDFVGYTQSLNALQSGILAGCALTFAFLCMRSSQWS